MQVIINLHILPLKSKPLPVVKSFLCPSVGSSSSPGCVSFAGSTPLTRRPQAPIHSMSRRRIHSLGAAFVDVHGCGENKTKHILFTIVLWGLGSVRNNSGGVLGGEPAVKAELRLLRPSQTFTYTFWRTRFTRVSHSVFVACPCSCSLNLKFMSLC